MNILLATSSGFELSVIRKTFPALKCLEDNSYSGRSGKVDLRVINTGTGMVSTAYHLTRYLKDKKFDLVLNAGICGSFHKDLVPGSVLVVEEEVFADLGAQSEGGFLDLFDLGLQAADDFPFEAGRIRHDPGRFAGMFTGMISGRGITVNTVTGTDIRAAELSRRYDPDVETMEGAAFFYVCRHEKLNFSQIRAVSNFTGNRNRKEWKIQEAMSNLTLKLKEIFNEL